MASAFPWVVTDVMPTYRNFFASTKDRIHVVVGRCTTPNRSPAHVGFVPKIMSLPSGTEPGFIPGGGVGAKLKTEKKNYENKN